MYATNEQALNSKKRCSIPLLEAIHSNEKLFYFIKSIFRRRNFTFRQNFFFSLAKKNRRADGISIRIVGYHFSSRQPTATIRRVICLYRKLSYQGYIMPSITFFATAQGLKVTMFDNFADSKSLFIRIRSQDIIIANPCKPEKGTRSIVL